MPDSSQPPAAPASSAGGGGFVGALKSKFGPLPTWGWLALITVVLLGYWLLTKNKSSSAQQPQSGTPADVGQPGVVVINQDGPEPPPPPPGPQPPPKGHHPPKSPDMRQITVEQDETLGQLAKQRHWSDATLKAVEEMNVTEGQGKWTPSTKLHKGQTVDRPLKG
jgi:hypothetical protein